MLNVASAVSRIAKVAPAAKIAVAAGRQPRSRLARQSAKWANRMKWAFPTSRANLEARKYSTTTAMPQYSEDQLTRLTMDDPPELRKAQDKARFRKIVDRNGEPKPELKQLIEDFTVTFLEFSEFHEFPSVFHEKHLAKSVIERYMRPLKPLEYYFTDTQLTQILHLRMRNTFAHMFPTKESTIEHMKTPEFLEELAAEHENESSEQILKRRDEMVEFVNRHMDSNMKIRPIKMIHEVLKDHPIAGLTVEGTLDDDLSKLDKPMLPSDKLVLDSAMRGLAYTPVFSTTELLIEDMHTALDKLKLTLTPTPTPSEAQNLPYYERLRLEGKSVAPQSPSSSRRSSSSTIPSVSISSSPQQELPWSTKRPDVFPFNALDGHIGHGAFTSLRENYDNYTQEHAAILDDKDPKPLIRQWTQMERSRLKTIHQYTTEWLVVNKCMDPPHGFRFKSGINWSEEPPTPEETRSLLDSTHPTPSSTPLTGPAETLRQLAQHIATTIPSQSNKSSFSLSRLKEASGISSVPQTRTALVEEANALLSDLSKGSKQYKKATSTSNEAVEKLSAQLEELMSRSKTSIATSNRTYRISRPGDPRSNHYQLEYDAYMSFDAKDSHTFKIRSPELALSNEKERNANLKLSWLILSSIASMNTQQLASTFISSDRTHLQLRSLWEAQQLAKQVVDSLRDIISVIDVSDADLAAVCSKISIDVDHLNTFLFEHLSLLGLATDVSTESASTDVSSIEAPDAEPLDYGVLPDGSITPEKRKMIEDRIDANHQSRQRRLAKASTEGASYDDATNPVDGGFNVGDTKNVDYVASKRKSKMDPKVRDLFESLTGPELRALFPLDTIYLHPFLTHQQRIRALLPVILSDEKLQYQWQAQKLVRAERVINPSATKESFDEFVQQQQEELSKLGAAPPVSSDGRSSLKSSTARAAYLENDFTDLILDTLRTKSLNSEDGTRTDFGKRVERASKILELPPIGFSITHDEYVQSLHLAKSRAQEELPPGKTIEQYIEDANSPEIRSLFGVGSKTSTHGDAILQSPTLSAKMEAFLTGGLPSNIAPGSFEARQLAADASAYQVAKKAKESSDKAKKRALEAEGKRVPLLASLSERFERLWNEGMIRPESRFLAEPVESDSYDVLLLKQDMMVKLEELKANQLTDEEQLYVKLPEEGVYDGDFVVTRVDGTTSRVVYDTAKHDEVKHKVALLESLGVKLDANYRWSKDDAKRISSDLSKAVDSPLAEIFPISSLGPQGSTDSSPPSRPFSALFEQHHSNSNNPEALQKRKILESEVSAIRGFLGIPDTPLTSTNIDEIKVLLSAFLEKITSLDPITLWEQYPDLAPPVPDQAIHGPFREVFDPLTIRRRTIPKHLRHMYPSMQESLTAWYLDRDEEGLVRRKQPMTPEDGLVLNQIIATETNTAEWLQAYGFDLGFPVEKVRLFHELLKLTPRLFRKMDTDRDMDMMTSMKDTMQVLQDNPTEAAKLDWFKIYHQQLAQTIESLRSVIGREGESYLEYNEMVVNHFLHQHKYNQTSHSLLLMDSKDMHKDIQEMDNPEERVLLQVLLSFIRTGLDETELSRLKQVKNQVEYELWWLWRLERAQRYITRKNIDLDKENANIDLPHGHPDKYYQGDEIDDEADASYMERKKKESQDQHLEVIPPHIPEPALDRSNSPLEIFAEMAKSMPERLKNEKEEQLDKEHWKAKDDEATVRIIGAMGFPTDPKVRQTNIQLQVADQVKRNPPPSGITTFDWLSSTYAAVEKEAPEHIRIDPLFQDMKNALMNADPKARAKLEKEMLDMRTPIAPHIGAKHAEAVSESEAQSMRIEEFLQIYPPAKHMPLDILRYTADAFFAQQAESLKNLRPEYRVSPENLTLEQATKMVKYMDAHDISTMSSEQIMDIGREIISTAPDFLQYMNEYDTSGKTMAQRYAEEISSYSEPSIADLPNVRQRFPDFDFDGSSKIPSTTPSPSSSPNEPPSAPSTFAESKDHSVSSSPDSQSSMSSPIVPPPIRITSTSGQLFDYSARLHSALSQLSPGHLESAPLRSTTISDANASAIASSSHVDHRPAQHVDPGWLTAYQLFIRVEAIQFLLDLPSTPQELKHSAPFKLPPALTDAKPAVEAFRNSFYDIVAAVSLTPPSTFPIDVPPLKLIPWPKIQQLLGFTDRQLKTLMLFLINKDHYLQTPSSRPPKMEGFYWDPSEFELIRNRFLKKRTHSSQEPTRDELLHDLLFMDTTVDILHRTPASSPSSTIIIEDPSDTPIDNLSSVDRLEWAREEARVHPLPLFSKLTSGQSRLVDIGLPAELFTHGIVDGLQKLIPVGDLPTALGTAPVSDEELLRRLKMIADLMPSKSPSSEIPSHAVTPDTIVKADFIMYEEGGRAKFGLENETEPVEYTEGPDTTPMSPEGTPPSEVSESSTGDENSQKAAKSDNQEAKQSGDKPKHASGSSETSSGESSSSAEGSSASSSTSTGTKGAEGDAPPAKITDRFGAFEATFGSKAGEVDPSTIDWETIEKEAIEEAEKEAQAYVKWKEETRMIGDDDDIHAVDEFDPNRYHMLQELHGMVVDQKEIKEEYSLEMLDADHLVDLRRKYHMLLMTKWSLLRKQMRELELEGAYPVVPAYMNALRMIWLNHTEAVFWSIAPLGLHHRKVLDRKVSAALLYSEKMRRRMMVDMAPLIWGARHHIPRDEFGEFITGWTPVEMVHRKFNEDEAFETNRGPVVPTVTHHVLPDPDDKVFRDHMDDHQKAHEQRKFFNKKRIKIFGPLFAIVFLGTLGWFTNDFLDQDEDTAIDRIGIETQILKTRIGAIVDRLGYGVLQFGSALMYVGRGISWIFTERIDADRSAHLLEYPPEITEEINVDKLLPPHMVRSETGGYYYREFMRAKSEAEIGRRRMLVHSAYELYEARGRGDPRALEYIEQQQKIIEEAVRFAHLRQYEKQKRDYANSQVYVPPLPRMPDWFEMPENRFWDAPHQFKFHAPLAENFMRPVNWIYHPDDQAPAQRIQDDWGSYLFHADVNITPGGYLTDKEDRKHTFWRPIPVDDFGKVPPL